MNILWDLVGRQGDLDQLSALGLEWYLSSEQQNRKLASWHLEEVKTKISKLIQNRILKLKYPSLSIKCPAYNYALLFLSILIGCLIFLTDQST